MSRKVAKTIVHTGDRLQDEQQARTHAVTDAINALPWALGAKLVTGQVFVANTVLVVKHGLGRKPKGYLTARIYSGANDQRQLIETSQTLDPTTFISLVCASSGTRDIIFF